MSHSYTVSTLSFRRLGFAAFDVDVYVRWMINNLAFTSVTTLLQLIGPGALSSYHFFNRVTSVRTFLFSARFHFIGILMSIIAW